MAKRFILVFCVAAVLFTIGCSNPSYLMRSVDDWQNLNYEKNPLATGLFSDIVPVYGLIKLFAAIPDVLFINPYQFWVYDAWRGGGVGFMHKNPAGTHDYWFRQEGIAGEDQP